MSEETKDGLEGIPKHFHGVVELHGRALFATVMNAAVAGEAVQVLGDLVNKHRSQHGMKALRVLAGSYNQASNAYVIQMGWTPEQLAHCQRDIQLAHQGQIIVPGSAIILDS